MSKLFFGLFIFLNVETMRRSLFCHKFFFNFSFLHHFREQLTFSIFIAHFYVIYVCLVTHFHTHTYTHLIRSKNKNLFINHQCKNKWNELVFRSVVVRLRDVVIFNWCITFYQRNKYKVYVIRSYYYL